MAHESSTKILIDMLSFVENEEDFVNYSWGRRSYERTFPSLNKDMIHQRENYLQEMKKNKKAKKAKYIVYGFSIALQYWAFEAIPKLTGAFSENLGIKFPKILSWTSNKTPSIIDCIDVFKIKKALLNTRKEEKEFYEHIYYDPHHSLGSTRVEEEGIDVEDEDENKKEAAKAKRAAEEAEFQLVRQCDNFKHEITGKIVRI
ncbi:hypothetical protein PanWU01x14_032120 [Parasponia andersonii]|uniref:DUF1985 domain-containing protein n=1 Tax=Parasponia andersonii TaxID=3476 RepID=A0A2P5DUB4_PARAD|nr:hypothetical protein PanWU01x14_032120 [Parasponia andersonii]